MQTDENIMNDVLDKTLKMIDDGDLQQAEKVLTDSYQLEAWRDQYGTEILISLAYCKIFRKDGQVDTASIRDSLKNLSEEKILSLPEVYQKFAYEIDNELQRLELIALPDEIEETLRHELETE